MSSECILIIDDSLEVVRHLSQELLPTFGYQTIQASNGKDGLAMMKQEQPDLVMLDLNLPKMTGLDVLRKMTAEGIDIPVLLMTGFGSEKSAIEAFRLGIKDYLVKPFTVDEVLNTIERVLAESRHKHDQESRIQSLQRAEGDLRRQLNEFKKVMRLGQSLLVQTTPQMIIAQALDDICQLCGAEKCFLWLRETDSPMMRAYSHQRTLRSPELDAPVHDSLVGWVYRNGRLVRDTAFSGRGTNLAPGVDARAFMLVPLRLHEHIVGVVGVTHETAPQAFSVREEELLQAYTDFMTLALDQSRRLKKQDRSLPAEELEALKSNFVMTVSHDLRAPLNSIVGFASTLMSMNSLDDQQSVIVEHIIKSAERMMRMVNALLDLARIDAGLPEPRESCELPALVDHVITDLQGKALNKNMRVEVIKENDLPQVWVNPHRMTQAISNLVDNALKFSPEGETVVIRLVHQSDWVILQVEDNGPGISTKDIPFIFDQFYQGANGQSPDGTGLGLALVRSITEAYGGEVLVKSELDAGSIFTIKLPSAASAPKTN